MISWMRSSTQMMPNLPKACNKYKTNCSYKMSDINMNHHK
ncbi:hypothetical protein F383_25272 [Gossypium arboreum]|uniref:Uncharacterized protein n=1 Tax=Gossypium arboreum TaxID=29729 RepID=A0A0B0P4K1_GOSAR|nr:hypothetical protein F383_25272 [Gossypium arboreum]